VLSESNTNNDKVLLNKMKEIIIEYFNKAHQKGMGFCASGIKKNPEAYLRVLIRILRYFFMAVIFL
jgi:hypothetical protein